MKKLHIICKGHTSSQYEKDSNDSNKVELGDINLHFYVPLGYGALLGTTEEPGVTEHILRKVNDAHMTIVGGPPNYEESYPESPFDPDGGINLSELTFKKENTKTNTTTKEAFHQIINGGQTQNMQITSSLGLSGIHFFTEDREQDKIERTFSYIFEPKKGGILLSSIINIAKTGKLPSGATGLPKNTIQCNHPEEGNQIKFPSKIGNIPERDIHIHWLGCRKLVLFHEDGKKNPISFGTYG